MRETFEFRIPEDKASQYLPDDVGVVLGSIGPKTRKLEVSPQDWLYQEIGRLEREFRARDDEFHFGWGIRRKYRKSELDGAQFFHGIVRHIFEPAGEECGTTYDESTACPQCGGGAQRSAKLILDARSLAKQNKLAIGITIAGEIVVSDQFVSFFQAGNFRGAEFQPVYRRARPHESIRGWHDLVPTADPIDIVEPTRAANAPFAELGGEYRCPRGDTIGLNLLSELWISKDGYEKSACDLAFTAQRVGVHRGVLRPEPRLLLSPRLWMAFEGSGLKGLRFEVVHVS